ncbi:uncharacterized protein si:dkey-52l18.4 [Engraulis encrasicolus]|uniref:uncharacterized protein si:dkey-52l18.4 n=1 Tax=Engraulis encrasicolus TaxID=184585 RepID=UPI002FD3B078
MGCSGEDCFPLVLARRDYKMVHEGQSLLLSCEVQHCAVPDWTGGWGVVGQGESFSLLRSSSKFHIYQEDVTVNSTRLHMSFISVNKSDSGNYQCRISWGQGGSSIGHLTYVNVTDGQSGRSERSAGLRLLVIICACLSFPLVMALVRWLSHHSAPAVPPRSHSTAQQSKRPRGELLYADLALENGGRPKQHAHQHTPGQPIIYSSLRF